MFRRLRWMILGAALAFFAYRWMKDRAGDARNAVPEKGTEIVREVRTSVQGLGARLRAAVREGREAMVAREEELRREVLGNGSKRG